MQLAQPGTGRDAELVVHDLPHRLEGSQRLRPAARAMQRIDQLLPEGFAQRMLVRQRPQLGDHLRVPAEQRLHFDPSLDHLQALLGKPWYFGELEPLRRDIGQRSTSPEREGLRQQPGLGSEISLLAGPPAAEYEVFEPMEVDRLRGHLDQVAVRRGPDQLVAADALAESHHVLVNGCPRSSDRFLAPEPVDQLIDGDGPVGLQQQGREDHPVLAGPERDESALGAHLERSEQSEPQLCRHPPHSPGKLSQHPMRIDGQRRDLRRSVTGLTLSAGYAQPQHGKTILTRVTTSQHTLRDVRLESRRRSSLRMLAANAGVRSFARTIQTWEEQCSSVP